MADPYRYFRVEAGEILEQLQTGLLALEKGSPASEVIPKLLRCAHTLKGAARVVKQKEIAEHCHAVEDLLVPIRDAGASVDAAIIESSLQHVDVMQAQLTLLSTSGATQAAAEGRPDFVPIASGEESFWWAKSSGDDLNELMDGIAELSVQIGALRASGTEFQGAARLAELVREQLAGGRAVQASEPARVRTLTLIEDLQSRLARTEHLISTSVEQAARELGQVRDAAEQLRLVPAASLFSSLERTARDASSSLGKSVTFEAHGGDIRLESELLSHVQQALVQAVRNAVAHGIEGSSERLAAHKSHVGVISIAVTRQGRHVAFSCSDDGRGLDLEAIRRRAQERGVASEALAGLNAAGLARLLLQGGISTARTVTGVAGRGIGLDLIREVANKMGGTVTLESVNGRETTVSIVVPLSLSALSALLVDMGGQVVALPLSAVRRTVQISDQITHTADGETILLDGKVVPYAALDRLLNPGAQDGAVRTRRSAVIIETDEGMVALGVERLLGIESVVVRGLPDLVSLLPVVSGASFDTEGNPQFVLSPEDLVRGIQRIPAAPRVASRRRAPILVIDDSLTTRMLEQSILESAGYEVDLAMSGEEGIEKARLRKYALFLVDVEMPGMDGFTFIERTRSDPELREVPAILVTSRASPEDVRRGRTVGALAHIEKREFSQTDLLERIRKLVS